MPNTEWMTDAECFGADPEVFFPSKGDSKKEAVRIWQRCRVRDECLDYAVEQGESFGIWGGLGAVDIKKERRRRNNGHNREETECVNTRRRISTALEEEAARLAS